MDAEVLEDFVYAVFFRAAVYDFAQKANSSTEVFPLGPPLQQQLPSSSFRMSVKRSVLPQVQRNTRYSAATETLNRYVAL